jgi:hypothetical protein
MYTFTTPSLRVLSGSFLAERVFVSKIVGSAIGKSLLKDYGEQVEKPRVAKNSEPEGSVLLSSGPSYRKVHPWTLIN